jgi:putative FmdB family regulatory protein
MPIYEYRCENGHSFEAFQPMSDDALDTCEVCEAPASRVLSAPAVHFKGSGFYTTDYARKGAHKPAESGGSDGKDAGSKDSSSKPEKGSAEKGSGSKSSEKASSSSSGSKSD